MIRFPNRSVGVMFGCVALSSTGMFTAITLGAIAAVESGGSRAASGLPAAFAIAGTATGALLLGALIQRSTWRLGLIAGWLLAALGAAGAAAAVQHAFLPGVLAGMLAIGFGNAGTQLTRYAAGGTVGADERGRAVAWIVWASAVGAVLGPISLGPVGQLAAGAGLEPGAAGFVMVAVTLVLAAWLSTRLRLAGTPAPSPAVEAHAPATGRPRLAPPGARAAIGCLVVTQACMVMVMAVTPVHLSGGGHAYGVVGTVMSGHFIGMFALAPLVGWVVDRLQPRRAIQLGMGVLAAGAGLAAVMPVAHGALLSIPLLTIGLGWCICFIAASAQIGAAVERAGGGTAAQGRIDSLVWIGSATASVLAGLVLDAVGYPALALVSLALAGAVALLVAPRTGRDSRVLIGT